MASRFYFSRAYVLDDVNERYREKTEDQDVDKESTPTGLSEIEDYKKFGLNSALSSAPETMGSEPLPALTKAPYPVMNSVGKVVGHLTKNSRITLEGIGDLGDYTTINALFKMEQAAILNNRGEHVPFDEGMTLNIDENDLSLLGLSRETVSDVNNHLQNLSFLKNLDLSQTVETATTETEERKKEEPPAEPTTFDEVVPLTEGFEIKAGDVVGFMGVYDTLVEKTDEENRQSIENRKVIDVNYISRKEYTNPYVKKTASTSTEKATPLPTGSVEREVKKGETLSSIAQQYSGVTYHDIAAASGIDVNKILPVDYVLTIPNQTVEEAEPSSSEEESDSPEESSGKDSANEEDSTLPKGKDHKRQAHLELFTVMEKSELEKFLENDAELLQDRKYVEVSGREHFYPEPITLDNPFMIPGTKKDDVLESKTKDIKENGVNNAIKAMLDLEEKAIRKELVDQIPILYEALKRAKDAGVEEYQSVPDTLKEYIDKYTDQHVKKFMKKRRKSYDEYRHRDVSQKENKIYYDTLQEELEKSQTSMEEAINKHYTDYGKVKRFAEDGEIVEILSVDPIKEGDTEYYSVKHDNKKGHIKKSSVKGEMFCQHDWDKLGFQIVEGEDDSHGYLEDDPIIKIFQAIYQAHPAHKKQGSSANSVTEIKDILEKGKKTNNQPVGDEKPSDFYWQKLVAKHPTEWQGLENSAYLEKFKAVLTEDHDDNLLKEQSDAVIAHEEERIEKLGFWDKVEELGSNKTPYHFHPIAFLENVIRLDIACEKKFELMSKYVLVHEGGYANRAVDKGGPTNHGIAWNTWKRFAMKDLGVEATLENLKSLTADDAKIIYRKRYWEAQGFCGLSNARLALMVYDWTITSGGAAKQIQRLLNNEYNQNLTIDGAMGSQTIKALEKISIGDVESLISRIGEIRQEYYESLTYNSDGTRNNQVKNLKGWTNRVNSCLNLDITYN